MVCSILISRYYEQPDPTHIAALHTQNPARNPFSPRVVYRLSPTLQPINNKVRQTTAAEVGWRFIYQQAAV